MIDLTSKFGRKVKRHLKQEYVIWLTTIGADLTPQPRPVWFIWDGAAFLIFSQPHAHKVRHVTAHPQVALHFNTDNAGDKDVIIFVGTAAIDTSVPPAHKVRAYRSSLEDLHQGLRRLRRRAAGNFGKVVQLSLDRARELLPVRADLIEHGPDDPLLFGQQPCQEVQGIDLRIALVGSEVLGPLNRFLGFDSELVESECHSDEIFREGCHHRGTEGTEKKQRRNTNSR